ncbi:MAG: hypothetical protein ABI679_05235 [Gemmatimonadota bacterium]
MAFLLFAAPVLQAQANPTLTPQEAEAWREDLHSLATALVERHPSVFYRTSKAQFDSAVSALDARIPTLRRSEAIVGLMQIVALVHDGHTSLNPAFNRDNEFHYYPLDLYYFRDGLYIRRAAPEYASLVGARVLQVGTMTPEEALASVGTVISHENDFWVKALAPFYLTTAEVVSALGISPSTTSLTLRVEQGGAARNATIQAAENVGGHGAGHEGPFDQTGWSDMRGAGDAPLYLQERGKLHWMTYLPDSKTLYVSYRAVLTSPEDPLPQFFTRVFAAADSLRPVRLVLDMRDNGGGNNALNKQFVLEVIRRTWLDQPGHFFAIIGRRTFSAAENMVNELERYTNVTFVGEPTGNSPNMYGDARPFPLPQSGLTVNISSIYWQTMNPQDPRLFVPPGIATEMSSDDYRRNVDPAMNAILRHAVERPVALRVADMVSSGDTVGGERLLRAAIADPENTWRSFEAEINRAGYDLLAQRKVPEAVGVFAINARVYPQSGNVWDSYGEGLENAGKRDLAVAAYRKALAIEPRIGSSRDGLRRLGAEP